VLPDGTVLKDGVLYERGRDGKFAPVKGLNPSALDRAIERKLAGGSADAPAMGLTPPTQDSPEMQTARAVQGMNAAQFSAYKRMQENQPLSPRERDLLRAAGIQIP
jgi:hypothetical protein